MKKFSKGVAEQLKHYVYRLIDPRDGQTFYIGLTSSCNWSSPNA